MNLGGKLSVVSDQRSVLRVRLSLAASRIRRGFTLIELMVVVGIIALLVGLTVGVVVTLSQKSETREIENALKLLDLALQEWETAADRQMTWGPNTPPYTPPGGTLPLQFDINSAAGGSEQVAIVLKRLKSTQASREILSRIDPAFLLEEDDPADADPDVKRWALRDHSGLTIVMVHPGRVANPTLFPGDTAAIKDEDGTIRTSTIHPQSPSSDVNENRLGICQGARICFIARGPDGKLGDLQLEIPDPAARDAVEVQKAQDNIYSYQLLRENP